LADIDNGEFMYQYDTQKALWVLAQVEFKTRNIQKEIANGGLGRGATVYPDYNAYEAFFTPQRGIACIPCGVTNVLGNKSGEVYFKMINVPVESTGIGQEIVYNRFADVWIPVMSYRGVENFYGHIYKIVDQITVRTTRLDEWIEGHSGEYKYRLYNHDYYYIKNPFLTDDSENPKNSLGTFKFPSDLNVVSSLLLGNDAHILHIDANPSGGMTTDYCDASELLSNQKPEYITFNGRIVSGSLVGFHFVVAVDSIDTEVARPTDGCRIDIL
jgi:hypothetical protein